MNPPPSCSTHPPAAWRTRPRHPSDDGSNTYDTIDWDEEAELDSLSLVAILRRAPYLRGDDPPPPAERSLPPDSTTPLQQWLSLHAGPKAEPGHGRHQRLLDILDQVLELASSTLSSDNNNNTGVHHTWGPTAQ